MSSLPGRAAQHGPSVLGSVGKPRREAAGCAARLLAGHRGPEHLPGPFRAVRAGAGRPGPRPLSPRGEQQGGQRAARARGGNRSGAAASARGAKGRAPRPGVRSRRLAGLGPVSRAPPRTEAAAPCGPSLPAVLGFRDRAVVRDHLRPQGPALPQPIRLVHRASAADPGPPPGGAARPLPWPRPARAPAPRRPRTRLPQPRTEVTLAPPLPAARASAPERRAVAPPSRWPRAGLRAGARPSPGSPAPAPPAPRLLCF